MKICFIGQDLDVKSGWGRLTGEITEGIKKRGIQIDSINTGKALRGGRFFSIFLDALYVRNKIKDCDIVHCFDGYPYGIIGALANIGLNKKLIINGVGTYSVLPLYQRKYKRLLIWAYKKASKILCISHFTASEIKKAVELDNIEVVTLGVDLKKFGNCPSKDKKTDDQKVILSVGGLMFRKGYHISIQAVAKVKESYPDILYYIIGNQSNEEYFNSLKKMVRDYGLDGNIKFLSNISDEELSMMYCDADLFLLTSVNDEHKFEGFGLVYLEANAEGLPVIGTLNCGAEDAIKDGYSGFLVPQNNAEETAKAILKILDDENISEKMKGNALLWAKANSWDTVIDKYINIYEKVIGEN